jgi:hypothetical protein
MRRGALWLIAFIAVSAGIHTAFAGEPQSLLGSRVRIETLGGSAPLIGTVQAEDANSLLVEVSAPGPTLRVRRDDVVGLEVSRGYRRRTLEGLGVGVLAWGALVGLYAAFDTLDESGVGEPLFVAGVVAAGGIVGSQIKTERWERIPSSRVSFRLTPARRGVRAELMLAF